MSRRIFSQVQEKEDNDNDYGSRAALPISKTKADLVNGQPVSGEDYLLLVRQQSKKCAQTVTAPPPKEKAKLSLPPQFRFFESESNDTCLVLPEAEWQEGFVTYFKSYQEYAQSTKDQVKTNQVAPTQKAAWHTFCYSKMPSVEKLNVVASLSQPVIITVLRYYTEWLEDMSEGECLWIYTLLLYLDPVMTAEHTSILRDISRKCIKLRSDKKEHDEQVFRLNMIITIIGKVFSQADLL
ncbi:predicted protein [Lichtheimia corymbifera JMRC:FSU:9682]|uniref:Gem-associated protein 2 n=1 Tax=Lichtheimia corymbifera JMRC:FSU:9682 TaxID=1263082 RepID=A0A068RNS4_9FUNG|nr:predicted protein [Lichtheimia corymbifera JMRC:FSU:9682]